MPIPIFFLIFISQINQEMTREDTLVQMIQSLKEQLSVMAATNRKQNETIVSQAQTIEELRSTIVGLNVSHTRQDIDDFALIDWEEEENWLDP